MFLVQVGFTQSSSERAARQYMEKQQWAKAYQSLLKSLQKDSLNAAAHYTLSQYFFAHANPAYNLDSAYLHSVYSTNDLALSSPKVREKLRRIPLDSLVINRHRARLDSAGFAAARVDNSEQAYLRFLARHVDAIQRAEAEALRDEAAYQDALKQNTLESFQRFLDRYPQAQRAAEAREHYDRHLYIRRTSDKQLKSYIDFVQQYPRSPWRHEAEHHILQLSTAPGTLDLFEAFIRQYPQSRWQHLARNIAYHLQQEDHHDVLPAFANDSLRQVWTSDKQYLIPFYRNGKYGMMDPDGRERMKAQALTIDDAYRCGAVTEDVLVMDGLLVSREGHRIASDKMQEVDDLGYGFLLVTQEDNQRRVLHKSGFMVGPNQVKDARLLQGRLLAIQTAEGWSVWTLAGLMIQAPSWSEISTLQRAIVLRRDQQLYLTTPDQLCRAAAGHSPDLSGPYDDVKLWADQSFWVRRGDEEGTLHAQVDVAIPLGRHQLAPMFAGALARSAAGMRWYPTKGTPSPVFSRIEVSERWVGVKTAEGWQLVDPQFAHAQSAFYDTLSFVGTTAMGINADSLHLHFSVTEELVVPQPAAVEFVPARDTAILVLQQGDKRTVYNMNGKRLFISTYDKVQYAGSGLFIVHKKEKKGLANEQGKLLLPVEYDAIGTPADGYVSLLRSMKFGIFHLATKKLIKPEYGKNLAPYNATYIMAFRDGNMGFIGWDNKPLSKFEFQEIHRWNDTTAIVKRQGQWQWYHLKSGKVVLDKVRDYRFIRDTPQEKLAIVHQENQYGVISSVQGTIIPMTFSDIVNVGTAEVPTYFTEKHVEEASIFVVIYYNARGQLIRREVYEQDDYEQIYCNER